MILNMTPVSYTHLVTIKLQIKVSLTLGGISAPKIGVCHIQYHLFIIDRYPKLTSNV